MCPPGSNHFFQPLLPMSEKVSGKPLESAAVKRHVNLLGILYQAVINWHFISCRLR